MTKEEKAIAFLKDMDECTYGNLEEVKIAIRALEALSQIYEITDGCAEALYQSEVVFDSVACVLTDYLEVKE